MPWMLVILVLQEADAKMDLEVREFLGLIPVKEEAGRVSEEVPSGTCERSSPFGAGSRVGREESQMGCSSQKVVASPVGCPGAEMAHLRVPILYHKREALECLPTSVFGCLGRWCP